MASPLSDLDELVLRCRDEKAKDYIAEAVASYRVGAYRSAIVATWIATCFDIIEKLCELALSGDKEAEKQVEDLERTRRSADLNKALKFEREILELARDKFELISHIEFIDLERLQADRNRCAHPSLISEEQAYSPSAELARVHIHAAVTHLLQHPPVQGKYALDRLLREIGSEYFPQKVGDAKTFLSSGPLRKPRESLVRNITVVLIKTILKEKSDWNRHRRLAAAAQAIADLHPQQYRQTLSEKLSPLFRTVEDIDLHRAVEFLRLVVDSWQHLDADIRHRLQSYVEVIPSDRIEDLGFILDYEPLRPHAEKRISSATRAELKGTLFIDRMPKQVVDRFVALYLDSKSFDQANEWGRQISFHISDFMPEHVQRILTNVAKNPQVLGSFELASLVNSLRMSQKIPVDEFDALLKGNDLGMHVPPSELHA